MMTDPQPERDHRVEPDPPLAKRIKGWLRGVDVRSIAVLLVIAFFAILSPGFRNPINVEMIVERLAYTAVAGLGLYLIILLGHIDLSVGSAMALAGGICCVLIQKDWSAPAAMGVATVALVGIYAFMGFLVAWARIPAFIVTLGGLLAYRGLANRIIENRFVSAESGQGGNFLSLLTDYHLSFGATASCLALLALGMAVAVVSGRMARRRHDLPLRPWWQDLAAPTIALAICIGIVAMLEQHNGVPLCLPVLGAIGLVMWFVSTRTRFGRWCFAVGGNLEAARLSGIPVRLVTLLAFVIAGALAAVAGFLIVSSSGSVTPTTANLMELEAIAACVIGGVSLMGGRGEVSRVFLGALLIVCLVIGMGFVDDLEPYDKMTVRGFVLVVAVWLDLYLQRRKSRASGWPN